MAKVKDTIVNGKSSESVYFICPGCGEFHVLNVQSEQRPRWEFNGNYERPTFTPSILARSGHYCDGNETDCWCRWAERHQGEKPPFKCGICHSFVTDGKIQFLSDSTHKLAGQTVELPDIED